ncbi:MAG: ABC-2 family transporter protein [Fibrobacteria bacterium]
MNAPEEIAPPRPPTYTRGRPGLAGELRTGIVYVMRSLQTSLAYTSAYAWDVVAALMAFMSVILVWVHVSGQGGLPATLERRGLFAYLTLVYCLNFGIGTWLEFLLGRRVRTGLIATDLLKPIDFQWMQFCGYLGEVLPQCLIGGLILILGMAVLPLAPFSGIGAQPVACLVSVALAVALQFAICYCFSLVSFVTHFSYGAFALRTALHFMFSGMMGPLALFQPGFRDWAAALPFAHILHTPAALMLGWIKGGDAWILIAQQAAWTAGLLLAGRMLLAFLVRRLVIQGG